MLRHTLMMFLVLALTGCSSILRFAYIESNEGDMDAIKAAEAEQSKLKDEAKKKYLADVTAVKPVLDPAKELDMSKEGVLATKGYTPTEISQGILVLVDKTIPEESFLVQVDKDVLCIRIGVKHRLATLFSDEFFLGVRKGVSVPNK